MHMEKSVRMHTVCLPMCFTVVHANRLWQRVLISTIGFGLCSVRGRVKPYSMSIAIFGHRGNLESEVLCTPRHRYLSQIVNESTLQ